MSYTKHLTARLEYAKAKEAAELREGTQRGGRSPGGASSGLIRPPAASCIAAAPMGVYGLLMKCNTLAPDSDDENESHDGHDDDEWTDDFDTSAYEPALTGDAPAMPVLARKPGHAGHRDKIPTIQAPFNACVARPVNRKEVASNPAARKACKSEWDRLRARGAWFEDRKSVREWKSIAAEARQNEETVHVGRLFCICVEKGSEFKPDDPRRKFKGRVVFQGNHVRDQSWDYAVFQELSSCPAAMEASRSCDAYGTMPGHDAMQADAEQAYIQAKLSGTRTWVELPREEWPQDWIDRGLIRPVCPLELALYGHPDSGGHWEAHCEGHLASVGFERIPDWHSTFWHPELKLFLVVSC